MTVPERDIHSYLVFNEKSLMLLRPPGTRIGIAANSLAFNVHLGNTRIHFSEFGAY